MKTVLVTGAAGFIGFHTCVKLLKDGYHVVGLDNMNDYYDVKLKSDRLRQISDKSFEFFKVDISDRKVVADLFGKTRPEFVVNLAAQAGVRYSIQHPYPYVDSNLVGFLNILEACRWGKVQHLVFASSSSVYGANTSMPFSVDQNVDHPLSLYAATKKANELMAHAYSHLYNLPCTGLRFFTVYGPWGRPDMSYFTFTRSILAGKPIDVYNHGDMKRDFTYVDDIVNGTVEVLRKIPEGDTHWDSDKPRPDSSYAPYKIYNIGNNAPVDLMKMIAVLEGALGIQAKINYLPLQDGDVKSTFADIDDLVVDVRFKPIVPIEEGIPRFVKWYRDYYHG
ncbi:MAG: NAD-dependent epimerase [Gammaproteobacteria bacterium]